MYGWSKLCERLTLDDERTVPGFFYQYGRPHRRPFAIGFVTTFLAQLPRLLPALVLGVALDATFLDARPYALPLVPQSWIPPTDGGQLVLTVLLLAGAFGLSAVLDWIGRRTFNQFRFGFVHGVRVDAYRRLQSAPMTTIERRRTGDLMSVLNNDVDVTYRFARDGLMSGTRFLAFGTAIVAYLAAVNWQLAATLLVVPLAVVVISREFTRRVEAKHDRVRERLGALNGRLETSVSGIDVVKTFGREREERRRVEDASAAVRDARWQLIKTRALFEPLLSGLTGTARAGVLLVGGAWILFGAPLLYAGEFTVGGLFTFLVYVGQMAGPFREVVSIGDSYQESRAAIDRINGLRDDPNRPDDATATAQLDDPDGGVAFESATFSYPDAAEPALKQVDLDVDAGATVGVVGPSGAGKSTLLKLLLRFYDADRGVVRIDGRDVRSIDRESLREAIGYVEQDTVLFEGTVAENVAYGESEPDEATVVRAAKRASAHEFVQSLPEGYDTTIGERGSRLSGGQRQRLSIARALYDDPAILVLDEATSHVDSETEAFIQRELRAVAGELTTFVVAHRLSTVTDADEIVVLDDGEVVETGSHEELLAAEGTYERLWRAQMGAIGTLADDEARTLGGDEVATRRWSQR